MDDIATLVVYRSRSLRRAERWRWQLLHLNGRIIATSGEGYTDRDECERQGRKIVSGYYR